MKKLFTIACFALATGALSAQSTSAVTACETATGGIEITFDLSKNCTSGPAGSADTLGKRTEIGFHSGANGWAVVREWDLANSVHGVRVGAGGPNAIFKVTLENPAAYYVLATTPTAINFVFNDGAQGNPATANFPWYAEGKDQGGGGCLDFFVDVTTLAACATGTQDLRNDVSVSLSPNPLRTSTVLKFNRLDGIVSDTYSVTLLSAAGQEVRSYTRITTGSVEIQREGLTKGLYFVVLQDETGRSLTEKLVVE